MSEVSAEQPVQDKESGSTPGEFILNSNVIFALAIFSIAGSWLYGIPGLCAGIISLRFSNKIICLEKERTDGHENKNMGKVRSARIFAIGGIVLSALFLLGLLVEILFYRTA